MSLILLKCSLTAFAALTVALCANAEGLFSKHRPAMKPTPAIYLRHIGESDKPILPFVISSARPSLSELESIFGKSEARNALLFTVSKSDLTELSAEITKVISSQRTDAQGEDFGTFRVTVVQDDNRLARTLSLADFTPVLAAVEKVATRYDSLQTHISSLKRRLQLD